MASQTMTSTPVNKSSQPSAPAPTPPPGTWEHPKLAEISRRRVRNEFDERNLRILVICTTFFLLSFYLPTIWPLKYLKSLDSTSRTAYTLLLFFTRTSIAYKAYTALRPLFHRKDDMSDIALTPSQRALLGLGPASAPATPGSTYITPPRYLRSSTSSTRNFGGSSNSVSSSRAATVGSNGSMADYTRSIGGGSASANNTGSPGVFGKSSSAAAGGGVFDSPVSGSPLARKAMGQRASLGFAGAGAGVGDTSTPSPVGQRNTGVTLTNKFLYQRRVASNGAMSSYI